MMHNTLHEVRDLRLKVEGLRASGSSSNRRTSALRAAFCAGMGVLCAVAAGTNVLAQGTDGMRFVAKALDVEDHTQHVAMGLGRTMIITTSAPVKRIQPVTPSVAVVQSVSPEEILVTGVGYGSTQVLVWSESGEQSVFQINVEMDLSVLNDLIARIDPQSDATAKAMRGHIVLSGTVSSALAAERMVQLAELSLPLSGAGLTYTVQNHLAVNAERDCPIITTTGA